MSNYYFSQNQNNKQGMDVATKNFNSKCTAILNNMQNEISEIYHEQNTIELFGDPEISLKGKTLLEAMEQGIVTARKLLTAITNNNFKKIPEHLAVEIQKNNEAIEQAKKEIINSMKQSLEKD